VAKNRNPNDLYTEQRAATLVLLKYAPEIGGAILEPCDGTGNISRELIHKFGAINVHTNDIDTQHGGKDFYLDAAKPETWAMWNHRMWVVSNPPFNLAPLIVPLALKHARVGIAMFLRLSYIEPTIMRRDWLRQNPPSRIINLWRMSFTPDGKSDSVTCAWFIWHKRPMLTTQPPILIIPESEGQELLRAQEARAA
jgi:hypothetical protein